MITTISECPINSKDDVLFASGCYDGTVAIWDVYEKNTIFSFECSNVMIW